MRDPAPRIRSLLLALVLATAGAACGSDNVVGGDAQIDGEGGEAACRLGDCTTTTTALATTTTPPTTAATKGTTTTARQTTTTQAAAATTSTTTRASIVIKIQSDKAEGGQFDPPIVSVPRNALVRWTNTDSVPRSVEAEGGTFRSPMLQPGASYDYRATQAGSFNYHDGTRPYAVGTLQVK